MDILFLNKDTQNFKIKPVKVACLAQIY